MNSRRFSTGFLFTCIISIVFLPSCKKYLDKKPNDNMAVPSTLQDLQRTLDDGVIMNLNTPSYGETSADDYFLTDDMYNFGITAEDQLIYKWARQEYTHPNDWSQSYNAIYNTNLCFEVLKDKIDSTATNSESYKNVKGTAYFFRAYHFLLLSWVYAKAYDPATSNSDLGIVLRTETDFNVPSVRATVKETYDKIISDAKAAADYLPDYAQIPTRPSKTAAYGLLARAYLSMNDYENAYKYANLCLALKDNLYDYNNADPFGFPPFTIFTPEVIFHSEMNLIQILHVPLIYGSVDTTIYASYNDNDLRKTLYFTPFGDYYTFIGSYSGNIFPLFTGIATDEIYLIRAESSARLGNKDAAMEDLNALMKNRWNSAATYEDFEAIDANDALNQVLKERRKELLFRGLRWSDIKRLNKKGANIILRRKAGGEMVTLPPNDNKYALPLPDDIIKSAKIEQN